jgi:hypothetical protein
MMFKHVFNRANCTEFWVWLLQVEQSLGGMDAAMEPTWMYLRRLCVTCSSQTSTKITPLENDNHDYKYPIP